MLSSESLHQERRSSALYRFSRGMEGKVFVNAARMCTGRHSFQMGSSAVHDVAEAEGSQ